MLWSAFWRCFKGTNLLSIVQLQKLRFISGSPRLCQPQKVTGRNDSSTRWLRRHLADPYVKKASEDNYRCRSAYKLIQLDDKYHFLLPGHVVIDCGASPGSWTQVAVERVIPNIGGEQGLVVAIDLLDIKAIPGAVIMGRCDFTHKATQTKILSLLPSFGVNVILSDMAPNSSGNHSLDHEAILDLCDSAFEFGQKTLKPGGVFLCKLWDGRGTVDFMQMLKRSFKLVKKCKPQASRKDSPEIYIYAAGFIK
ncbi:ribosomal RNA large subunit methyltransferase E isoform X2 [Nematostella vectensis]|uniref:ribosomal RNA large subunit methyltransferase E isoform X2 n=1 Tax=Nematostella vectensis TaxID=45351 RepID=UPI002077290F|nr:ribosomal RNA large subunit methyltransferase E isoform X2 [Nematostella vectensis]